MQDKQLLFFDIEIFAHDALVIFKDIDKRVVKAWHNQFEGLLAFVKERIIVGYNNYYYDDKILTRMMECWSPEQLKKLNDEIIKHKIEGHKIDERIVSLDCFQQIDVSQPSLKKIEGNMGRSILESPIPFDLPRRLTSAEFQEVFEYCSYDIDTTIDIYKIREKGYFQSKEQIIGLLEKESLKEKARRWNTTTISANVLIPKFSGAKKWSSMRIPDGFLDYVPDEVRQLWDQVNDPAMDPKKFNPKTVTVQDLGCDFIFAFGGLHGAHKKKKRVRDVKMLDVASMYPNIILNLGALGEGHHVYQGILDRRMAIKHLDKIMSDALKLILNSAYGNLNNQYSILNNPRAAYSVCVYGQIALYELCKRLAAANCEIINVNTDGVGFTTDSDDYVKVWKGWEQDFRLTLEEDRFDLFVQKDVNNYIGVKGDRLKCKGGDVNRYEGDAFFKNNNARILDIALVNKVVHGADVLQTLIDNLDKPHLYQYILKAGGTYQGTFDREGRQYQGVNRVFAVKRGGVCLQKRRIDGGHVHFADTPENMLVWNDECSELKDFDKLVDLGHYYSIIQKRLEKWEA
jgi:hypothetical protein